MRRVVMMIGGMVCGLALLAACIQPVTRTDSPKESSIEMPAVVAQPVIYRETTVTLPTYAYEAYQSDAVDEQYAWPYKKFDRERFLAEPPPIEEQTYRLLILENEYLVVQILPEIGGRIWQVIHKPSGHTMFYQNPVIKPSPWGPGHQLGWIAAGGLEWNLPVIEHGYDWGTLWDYRISLIGSDTIAVVLSTPQDGRLIHAEMTVSLQTGVAAFDIEPLIMNRSGETLDMDYWHSAALAPGPENQPSAALRFISPGDTMIVHSTGNPQMPPPEGEFTWPIYNDLDLSLLGNWEQYLGFFESPAAVGPFVGIYDQEQDAGAVRIYPADVAQGNKVFGLGFNDPIPSDNFTDDGSFYVEIHGGLAPSFFQSYTMEANANVIWRERWYPLWGIGDFVTANEWGALNVEANDGEMTASLYPTEPVVGTFYIFSEGQEMAAVAVEASMNS